MDLLPYMEQWNMLPEQGGVILCAVSGGRDSMCLLHYLHQLGKTKDFTVAAAHLNHLMRPTAERDVNFVRGFCEENGIPFFTEAVPVCDRAKLWNVTVEEAGRRARYDFLERTADAAGAVRIATAHHQNDQAETVLLNLLRGTGPEGLGGIPPVRGRYIRPLLNIPRAEIETYLQENGIGHIEDETNADTDFARNRLRLEIWPRLASINGALTEHIASAAAITRRENDYLDGLASELLPAEGAQISCEKLQSAPPVLQSRMVRLLLRRLPTGKKDVGAVHIDAILRLTETGGTLSLPSKMQAVCRSGELILRVLSPSPPAQELCWGENRWGEYLISLMKVPDAPSGMDRLDCLGDNCSPGVTVRSWRSEDRLILPGSRGARSLKRLFADRGICSPERETIPVICVDNRVCAVFSVGQDTDFLQEKKIAITIKRDLGGND